jgi:hypothetical protein
LFKSEKGTLGTEEILNEGITQRKQKRMAEKAEGYFCLTHTTDDMKGVVVFEKHQTCIQVIRGIS